MSGILQKTTGFMQKSGHHIDSKPPGADTSLIEKYTGLSPEEIEEL